MGRVIMGVAGLALAGSVQAAPPGAVRLPLSLASLGNGPEISYQPHRWLTIRRSLAAARSDVFHEHLTDILCDDDRQTSDTHLTDITKHDIGPISYLDCSAPWV
ncbi:MAG: hypothetical protein EOP61_35465 [Sphingomonadales bacterium]|nr:MAG: hypothetical protein EOP61_35465 [Sphingomonadales bacterium]